MPVARSGHDFLQVHNWQRHASVWLVPTSKTATDEMATRNFVASVFRDVALPDVLVSDRDSAFWTALHAALGGSPHHHTTTRKVGRPHRLHLALIRCRPRRRRLSRARAAG